MKSDPQRLCKNLRHPNQLTLKLVSHLKFKFKPIYYTWRTNFCNVCQLQFLPPHWVYILIEHNNNNNMMASVYMLNSVVTLHNASITVRHVLVGRYALSEYREFLEAWCVQKIQPLDCHGDHLCTGV